MGGRGVFIDALLLLYTPMHCTQSYGRRNKILGDQGGVVQSAKKSYFGVSAEENKVKNRMAKPQLFRRKNY